MFGPLLGGLAEVAGNRKFAGYAVLFASSFGVNAMGLVGAGFIMGNTTSLALAATRAHPSADR